MNFKFSQNYINQKGNVSLVDYISVAIIPFIILVFLFSIFPKLFDNLYLILPFFGIASYFLMRQKRKIQHKIFEELISHQLTITKGGLKFTNQDSEFKLNNIHNAKIHINLKNNEIKSLLIIAPDQLKIFLEGYSQMNQILSLVTEYYSSDDRVIKHKFFHKIS